MKRRFSLSLKLSLSFALAILLSTGLIYYLTTRSITRSFYEYGRTTRQIIGSQLAANLALFYEERGSWINVHELILRPVTIEIGGQFFMGRMAKIGGGISLANEEGMIFTTTESSSLVKRSIEEAGLEVIIPILVDAKQVGTLGLRYTPDPREAAFVAGASHAALIGGGISFVVALTLSIFLVLQILSPLRKLAAATEQVARGELPDDPVKLKSRDEIGHLGESFNQMVANLRRSETLRQMMTADIAHELRTPVSIIQGTLEALLDGVYEPTGETLGPIFEETLHLGRLIDDLRDLALAEAGELRLEKEPVNLESLIRQVTEAAVSSPEEAPTLRFVVEPSVPLVEVDPKRLRQVLANLLSNAMRVTPTDGEIRIEIARAPNAVRFVVTDTGPGISEEDLPHLFERFYRGDPARNRGGGTGLGLAIVKQWVEAHGGVIRAENDPNGGARFSVWLPLA